MEPSHAEATAVHALPAEIFDGGFRLLLLRQFDEDGAPPAFAFIDQFFMRAPQRISRHGVGFAAAFLPEIVAWLSARLGRPSLRDEDQKPFRNPRWPQHIWRAEARVWPDGTRSIEWSVEVIFRDLSVWPAFEKDWRARLQGRIEGRVENSDDGAAGVLA